ncbi:MAG: hypothetical protein KC609_10060 [Myxococcales bacterium]|nr:hypothetical protein [Myxococcales bacterium]
MRPTNHWHAAFLAMAALILLIALGCKKDDTTALADATADTVDDTATLSDLSPDDAETLDTTACELRYSIEGLTIETATRTISFSAAIENLTGSPLAVTVTDSCPSGIADFSGAPDGHDYYGSCAAGACSPERPTTQTITLAPGEKKIIASTTISLDGDTCNPPIPKGQSLTLSFALPLVDPKPVVCGPTTTTLGTDF